MTTKNIILVFIVLNIIAFVIVYFTILKKEAGKSEEKKEEKKDNWNFIKNKDFKIHQDSDGHEYIECNILIKNTDDIDYKYIGIFDKMLRDDFG